MTDPLAIYMRRFLPFSDEELLRFKQFLKPVELKKGEFFLHEGDVCHNTAFIQEGLFRIYHVHNDKEITRQFIFENSFFTEYESFLAQKPSFYYVEALEDCKVLMLHYKDLNTLYDSSVTFLRLGKMIAENVVQHVGHRYMSILRDDATTRYNNLVKERPKVLQRVPQYMIASYLGITPEALSRIRKNLAS
ncbi:MAG TPA: Crp/Fnr family transcriptional regulator [Chryseolinea sp.]|nr:Crp/Fnr family transcriptional regulator [Chryseolinea sp.]